MGTMRILRFLKRLALTPLGIILIIGGALMAPASNLR